MKSNFPSFDIPHSLLEELLPTWREVPLYRDVLTSRAGFAVPGDFAREFFSLPLIGKREMRDGFPTNFLRSGQRLETLLQDRLIELEHTSGTSEDRVPVLFGRGWWGAQEERALRLNAVVARVLDEYPHARRATLTTPTCNSQACHTNWLSRAERTEGATQYVNLARIPFLLKDSDLARMADEIAAWSPQFLDLDPVHGAWFALYCEKHGLRFPSLKFNLASYEFVSVVHRRILERVFGVPVFNLYGSTETGHLLMQDEHGEMRPCRENAFLEIVEPDAAGVGDLVVTTLTNDYMPLVRYRIGDLVQRTRSANTATYRVHGRARDLLRRRDGRRVTTLDVDDCFASVDGLAHYRLRQTANDRIRLAIVPDHAGPSPENLRTLAARLENLLQPAKSLVIETVKALPPTASGKFRLTQRAG